MMVELSDVEARLIESALGSIRIAVQYRQGLPHAVFTKMIQSHAAIRAAIVASEDKLVEEPLVWSS